jgi:hypothetical protein
MDAAKSRAPELSVIVPVRDGAHFLPSSLAAVCASSLPRESWELIVVDDGSRDSTAEVAGRYADRVLRLPAPALGPPAARNVGAGAARAPILVFIDADVCVHADALQRIRDRLGADPALSALFGSYDRSPAARDLVSQYRNLLHAYMHNRAAGEAVTFWTGLGAIRRTSFDQAGRFDESERLDDVELGYRVSALGHRIVLDPTIQGTHLKRWTLGSVIVTDVRDRGVPWVRLLIERRPGSRRATLNVDTSGRVLTVLTAVAAGTGVPGAITGEPVWLALSGVAAAATIVGDRGFLGWLARERGWLFTVRVLPLRFLYYGLNVVSIGLALLPLRKWHRRSPPQSLGVLEGAGG